MFIAVNRPAVLAVVVLLVPGTRVAAQTRQSPPTKAIAVDMTSAGSAWPDAADVRSGTPVTITIAKNPFQSCTVDSKAEVVKPETSALASLLGIMASVAGGAPADCARSARVQVPDEEAARRLDDQLTRANVHISATVTALQSARSAYARLAASVQALARCEQAATCASDDQARRAARSLARDIRSTLGAPPTVSATALSEIDALVKSVTASSGQGGAAWLDDVSARLACIQQKADAAVESRKVLAAAHDALFDVQQQLEALATDASTTMIVGIHPGRNLTTTVTISCVNAITKQPVVYVKAAGGKPPSEARTVAPVTVTVNFRDRPRATVSAGVMVSALGKRQLGTQPIKTGVDTSGAATFTTKIVETEASDTELVPFSFLNYALAMNDSASFNVAAGIGLNPNNGSKQVEYFLGAAIGMKGVFVEIGGHIGRREEPINGFAIGDVPADKFPGVPFARKWKPAFAIALTYKIPLPK